MEGVGRKYACIRGFEGVTDSELLIEKKPLI